MDNESGTARLRAAASGVRVHPWNDTDGPWGDALAEARAYESGVRGERDLAKAVELYWQAAQLGSSSAYLGLGTLFWHGSLAGPQRDTKLALQYLEAAAAMGDARACRAMAAFSIEENHAERVDACWNRALSCSEFMSDSSVEATAFDLIADYCLAAGTLGFEPSHAELILGRADSILAHLRQLAAAAGSSAAELEFRADCTRRKNAVRKLLHVLRLGDFRFVAEDIAEMEAPNMPPGFVVTGTVRSGEIAQNDPVLVVSPNDTAIGRVFGIEHDGQIVKTAAVGQAVGIAVVDVPENAVADAFQADADSGLCWLSLGLVAASAQDDTAGIEQLRGILTNLRPLIEAERTKVIETAQSYLQVLLRKYDQLTYVDDYDTLELAEFEKEVSHFISKKLPDVEESFAKPIILDVVQRAHAKLRDRRCDSHANMGPFEYEAHCAEQLRRSGWNAKATKRTGDQGCDVIAEREGRRVVLQCKLYEQPVGNKAVQEAFAAQRFHGADAAYVVSNSTFTKSACQLASSLGVQLIHHEELGDIG